MKKRCHKGPQIIDGRRQRFMPVAFEPRVRRKLDWALVRDGVILAVHHEPTSLEQCKGAFGPGCEVIHL